MEANKIRTVVSFSVNPRIFYLIEIFHQRFYQEREILHHLVLLTGNSQSMLPDKLMETGQNLLLKQMEGDSNK